MTAPASVTVRTTIRTRLLTLADLLIEDSKLDGMTKTIVKNLLKNFLSDKISEEDLRAQVLYVRNEIIPLILGDQAETVTLGEDEAKG